MKKPNKILELFHWKKYRVHSIANLSRNFSLILVCLLWIVREINLGKIPMKFFDIFFEKFIRSFPNKSLEFSVSMGE
jgi:hypothetical protein